MSCIRNVYTLPMIRVKGRADVLLQTELDKTSGNQNKEESFSQDLLKIRDTLTS